jgi:hypothetical protein
MPESEERSVLLATHVSIYPGIEPGDDRNDDDETDSNDSGNGVVNEERGDEYEGDEEQPSGGKKNGKKEKGGKKGGRGDAIKRLRLFSLLLERPEKANVVLKELGEDGDGSTAVENLVEMANMALEFRWDDLRAMVAEQTWEDFASMADAWLSAEWKVAERVGQQIEDVARRRLQSKNGGERESAAGEREYATVRAAAMRTEELAAVGPDGSRVVFRDQDPVITHEVIREEPFGATLRVTTEEASAAGQVLATEALLTSVDGPAPLPELLEALPGEEGTDAIAYLWGPVEPYQVDAQRILSQVAAKTMLFNGLVNAAAVEPVGYLHLEKLFFEPEGVALGELVQTIPLMPGETRRFTHTEWANTRSEYAKLITESLEKLAEQTLAETSELTESTNAESSRDTALSLAANVSGSYGTVSFSASAGLNVNTAESQSRATSASRSREITEKASSRSKQERKIEFRFTTEEGTSDIAFQEVTNPSETEITWAYNRVMTEWKVTLARYGIRLTYDLVIPDPANRLLRLYQRLFDLRKKLAAPDGFSLAPTGINRWNFASIAAQYGAPIDPPAPERVYVVAAANHGQPGEYQAQTFALTLTAPSGYRFTGGYMARSHRWGYSTTNRWPTLDAREGSNAVLLVNAEGSFPWEYVVDWPGGSSGGSVYIQVRAEAQQTATAFQQWQTDAWEQIHDAYMGNRERLKGEWRREIEELEGQVGGLDALSLRKLEREEIMRATLAWLIGPQFDFYPDVLPPPATDLGPDIGLYTSEGEVKSDFVHEEFLRHGELIQFLHQAIEWENLIYIVYPYFWTHESRWEPKDGIRHDDFVHQAFLRGGAARVVLTIRPGFENSFLAYVETAGLSGSLPAGHPYVTVAEELRNMAQTTYPYTPAATPPDPQNVVDTWNEYTPNGALYLSQLTLA